MKVTLIANLSANGKVLLAENPHHAAAPEALGFFIQKIVQAGNVVIGRKTLEVLQQFPGGIKGIFPGVDIIVLSTTAKPNDDFKVIVNVEHAISYLSAKGAKEVIIGGGTKIYNAFLDHDLVTDIYFNTIPMVISNGGVLGSKADLTLNFKLAEHKLLVDGVGHMHLTKA